MPIQTRKHSLHSPIICEYCRKEITKGQRYTTAPTRTFLTYRLTNKGKAKLGELLDQYTPPLDNYLLHQFMTACTTASIELACKKHGLRYITTEEILKDAPHKSTSIPVSNGSVIPDKLFGIAYGEKKRYFLLEADRSENDWERMDRKISKYREVWRTQPFYDLWGIKAVKGLIYTAFEYRAKKLLEMGNSKYWLVKPEPFFSARGWEVPPILYNIVEEPWKTVDGEFSILKI